MLNIKWESNRAKWKGQRREREERGGHHLADLFLHSLQTLQHRSHGQYGSVAGRSVVCFWFLGLRCGLHGCGSRLRVRVWAWSVSEILAIMPRDIKGKREQRSWAGWRLDLETHRRAQLSVWVIYTRDVQRGPKVWDHIKNLGFFFFNLKNAKKQKVLEFLKESKMFNIFNI